VRFTAKREAELLARLRLTPDAHVLMEPSDYRADGSVLIHRGNRAMRLHRYLAVQMGYTLTPDIALLPKCDVEGCQNPRHFEPSRRRSRGGPTHCPNNHAYADQKPLAGKGKQRCRICRDARNARRRVEGGRAAGRCKLDHPLTPANTYRWTDAQGRAHRKCKRCARRRARETKNENRSTS
jgi:hypothetical protein